MRVALDEARLELLEDAQQVVEDKHLPVGRRPGADANCRDSQPFGHRGGDLRRHRLEYEREAASRF